MNVSKNNGVVSYPNSSPFKFYVVTYFQTTHCSWRVFKPIMHPLKHSPPRSFRLHAEVLFMRQFPCQSYRNVAEHKTHGVRYSLWELECDAINFSLNAIRSPFFFILSLRQLICADFCIKTFLYMKFPWRRWSSNFATGVEKRIALVIRNYWA